MSLRKFISGVTAFAVAASAFAAMAVTASAAEEHKTDNEIPRTLININRKVEGEEGVYSLKNYDPAGVIADLSGFTDIDKATSITVEFDTYVVGTKNALANIMYGVGDKKVRGLTGNGSGSDGYNQEGLITCFGSEDGATYFLKDGESFNASAIYRKSVNAKITLNRVNGAYSIVLEAEGVPKKPSVTGTTKVDNITVIEAFTWNPPQAYDVTFKNIKVSYTVPVAPTGILQEATWSLNPGAERYIYEGGNVIKNGDYSIYGYYADLAGTGTPYTYTIKADLYADGANNHADGLELGKVTGTGDVTVYVITNAALDLITGKSRIYCE